MPRFGGMGAAFGRMGGGGKVPAAAAAAAFSPLDLTPALWIDPSDTTTMFQSNAGTTTVTDGSVCGYAGDKSGNVFHLTSTADDTTRPTWNNNAGLPYLNFDGVSQVLRKTSALGLYAAGFHSIFFAMRGNPITTGEEYFSEGGSGTNAFVSIRCDTTTASSANYIQRNDASGVPVNVITNTSAFANADKVFGLIDSGTTATGYINGVAGTPQTATRSGVYTLDGTALCALWRGSAAAYARGRIYGVVGVKRAITAGEIASVTTYLGAKMGLSL